MDNSELLAMDMDECPAEEAVIYQGMCSGCEYYNGFELFKGLRCIKCSYFSNTSKEKMPESAE